MEARSLEEILKLPKDKKDLILSEALIYLNYISFRIGERGLRDRILKGRGPRYEKRSRRLFFSKFDLDAWKKHETTVVGAYEKAS